MSLVSINTPYASQKSVKLILTLDPLPPLLDNPEWERKLSLKSKFICNLSGGVVRRSPLNPLHWLMTTSTSRAMKGSKQKKNKKWRTCFHQIEIYMWETQKMFIAVSTFLSGLPMNISSRPECTLPSSGKDMLMKTNSPPRTRIKFESHFQMFGELLGLAPLTSTVASFTAGKRSKTLPMDFIMLNLMLKT